jgi:hypothetical protein
MTTTTHATSTFAVKSWDEPTLSEVEGHLKITRATVAFAYSGDIEGEGAMHYLMLYRDDGSASVIGMERITARLGGRVGSFVLKHRGGYANGMSSTDFEVVDGSASGELTGLRGRGNAVARQDGSTEFTFDYEFGA